MNHKLPLLTEEQKDAVHAFFGKKPPREIARDLFLRLIDIKETWMECLKEYVEAHPHENQSQVCKSVKAIGFVSAFFNNPDNFSKTTIFNRWLNDFLREAVSCMYAASGDSLRATQVCFELGVTHKKCSQIFRSLEIPLHRGGSRIPVEEHTHRLPKGWTEQKLRNALQKGKPTKKIARAFGVSNSRVKQIIKANLPDYSVTPFQRVVTRYGAHLLDQEKVKGVVATSESLNQGARLLGVNIKVYRQVCEYHGLTPRKQTSVKNEEFVDLVCFNPNCQKSIRRRKADWEKNPTLHPTCSHDCRNQVASFWLVKAREVHYAKSALN